MKQKFDDPGIENIPNTTRAIARMCGINDTLVCGQMNYLRQRLHRKRWHIIVSVIANIKSVIQEIKNTPNTMVGFVASETVTKEDFDNIVLPAVDELVKRTDKLNYLLVLETPLKNFTPGAWLKDAMLGLNHLNKWNRAGIVTDKEGIKTFTSLFSKVMPGEFRGFGHDELDEAIRWVGEQDGLSPKQVYQEEGDSKD